MAFGLWRGRFGPRSRISPRMQSGSTDARPSSKPGMMHGQGEKAAFPKGILGCDLRRARHIGMAKPRLEHILIAAWLNPHRLGEWFAET